MEEQQLSFCHRLRKSKSSTSLFRCRRRNKDDERERNDAFVTAPKKQLRIESGRVQPVEQYEEMSMVGRDPDTLLSSQYTSRPASRRHHTRDASARSNTPLTLASIPPPPPEPSSERKPRRERSKLQKRRSPSRPGTSQSTRSKRSFSLKRKHKEIRDPREQIEDELHLPPSLRTPVLSKHFASAFPDFSTIRYSELHELSAAPWLIVRSIAEGTASTPQPIVQPRAHLLETARASTLHVFHTPIRPVSPLVRESHGRPDLRRTSSQPAIKHQEAPAPTRPALFHTFSADSRDALSSRHTRSPYESLQPGPSFDVERARFARGEKDRVFSPLPTGSRRGRRQSTDDYQQMLRERASIDDLRAARWQDEVWQEAEELDEPSIRIRAKRGFMRSVRAGIIRPLSDSTLSSRPFTDQRFSSDGFDQSDRMDQLSSGDGSTSAPPFARGVGSGSDRLVVTRWIHPMRPVTPGKAKRVSDNIGTFFLSPHDGKHYSLDDSSSSNQNGRALATHTYSTATRDSSWHSERPGESGPAMRQENRPSFNEAVATRNITALPAPVTPDTRDQGTTHIFSDADQSENEVSPVDDDPRHRPVSDLTNNTNLSDATDTSHVSTSFFPTTPTTIAARRNRPNYTLLPESVRDPQHRSMAASIAVSTPLSAEDSARPAPLRVNSPDRAPPRRNPDRPAPLRLPSIDRVTSPFFSPTASLAETPTVEPFQQVHYQHVPIMRDETSIPAPPYQPTAQLREIEPPSQQQQQQQQQPTIITNAIPSSIPTYRPVSRHGHARNPSMQNASHTTALQPAPLRASPPRALFHSHSVSAPLAAAHKQSATLSTHTRRPSASPPPPPQSVPPPIPQPRAQHLRNQSSRSFSRPSPPPPIPIQHAPSQPQVQQLPRANQQPISAPPAYTTSPPPEAPPVPHTAVPTVTSPPISPQIVSPTFHAETAERLERKPSRRELVMDLQHSASARWRRQQGQQGRSPVAADTNIPSVPAITTTNLPDEEVSPLSSEDEALDPVSRERKARRGAREFVFYGGSTVDKPGPSEMQMHPALRSGPVSASGSVKSGVSGMSKSPAIESRELSRSPLPATTPASNPLLDPPATRPPNKTLTLEPLPSTTTTTTPAATGDKTPPSSSSPHKHHQTSKGGSRSHLAGLVQSRVRAVESAHPSSPSPPIAPGGGAYTLFSAASSSNSSAERERELARDRDRDRSASVGVGVGASTHVRIGSGMSIGASTAARKSKSARPPKPARSPPRMKHPPPPNYPPPPAEERLSRDSLRDNLREREREMKKRRTSRDEEGPSVGTSVSGRASLEPPPRSSLRRSQVGLAL